MRRAFKVSRLIGLLTLALGLTVFSAATAQAEPGAYWQVEGTKLISPVTLLPKIQAVKDSVHLDFISKAGLSKVEILCTDIKFVNGLLHVLGRLTGKIHLAGCITKLNNTVAGACAPKSPGAMSGLIETQSLEGLLELHELSPTEKVDVLRLVPSNANAIFVEVEFGASCSIGAKVNITGTLVLKDCEGHLLEEWIKHLFEEDASLTKLIFGSKNVMTVSGSFWTFLEGDHYTNGWSGNTA